MATTERRKTDYFCLKCRRPLRNSLGVKPKHRDTITAEFNDNGTFYRHDQCGKGVMAGRY